MPTENRRLLGGTFPDAARARHAIEELVGDPARAHDVDFAVLGKGESVLVLVGVKDGKTQGWAELYSIAGLLPRDRPLVVTRPFRAPHHTASHAGLVGGGRTLRAGEVIPAQARVEVGYWFRRARGDAGLPGKCGARPGAGDLAVRFGAVTGANLLPMVAWVFLGSVIFLRAAGSTRERSPWPHLRGSCGSVASPGGGPYGQLTMPTPVVWGDAVTPPPQGRYLASLLLGAGPLVRRSRPSPGLL